MTKRKKKRNKDKYIPPMYFCELYMCWHAHRSKQSQEWRGGGGVPYRTDVSGGRCDWNETTRKRLTLVQVGVHFRQDTDPQQRYTASVVVAGAGAWPLRLFKWKHAFLSEEIQQRSPPPPPKQKHVIYNTKRAPSSYQRMSLATIRGQGWSPFEQIFQPNVGVG